MSFMGAASLNRLRQTTEGAMPGTAVVWRRTLTSDGAGGQHGTVVASGTVPCRAIPRRGRHVEHVGQAGRVTGISDWEVCVPLGTDVNASTDYLVVQDAGTFDILATNTGRSFAVQVRLACSRRQ